MKKLEEFVIAELNKTTAERRAAQNLGNPAQERMLFGRCNALVTVLDEINRRKASKNKRKGDPK